MKKYLIIILVLFIFILTGCDVINQMTCDHEYVILEEVSSTCTTEGYRKVKCNKCQSKNEETLLKLDHEYTEWNIIKNATETEDGLKTRQCLVCNYIDEKIIYANTYIDLDIIRFEYFDNKEYNVNSYEELEVIFNAALLNMSSKMVCNLNFEISDFNALLQKLVNESRIPLTFKVSASLKNNKLEMTYTYENTAIKTTTNYVYSQYQSVNYQKYQSSRTSDFNNFKINNSKYTFNVSTTDQLLYALERKVLPTCKEGSNVQTVYNEMKNVLIEIIDDKMTDFQKVKAIHDWLVLNVTYDDELLNLVSKNQNVKEYNGFYLEGVFLDKKAVCEGIAKAFSCMANMEGIPCVVVEGYQTNNPNGVGHAWNKVYIDDTWYIVDATSDGTIINNEFEILSYQFFLIDEKTMNKKYTGKVYNNLICNENYNYYKNYNYSFENNTYDYIIDSQSELTQLIKYFNIYSNKNSTIEFKVAFNFGNSIDDEVQTSCNELQITGGFSYITTGDIIVLIKK